jgi:hypothetical protein
MCGVVVLLNELLHDEPKVKNCPPNEQHTFADFSRNYKVSFRIYVIRWGTTIY